MLISAHLNTPAPLLTSSAPPTTPAPSSDGFNGSAPQSAAPGRCPFTGFGAPEGATRASDETRAKGACPYSGMTPPQPAPSEWPEAGALQAVLCNASKDVADHTLQGDKAAAFDANTAREIDRDQHRAAKAEGVDNLNRLVHRQQLFGGQAQVSWNPQLRQLFDFFDKDQMSGLIRISDASSKPDPDGASMYGLALELNGSDGKPSDILMTGGTALTEASQARDAKAQLALFNMLNPPSLALGLVRIFRDCGLLGGIKMLKAVKKMRTSLDSVANLTAWSRAPFELNGKDGHKYLVKMRAVPLSSPAGGAASGKTSSERLTSEFENRLSQGDVRWRLDFQFMQPGDDAQDARKVWHGPWMAAGQIALPKTEDPQTAAVMWQAADNTRFSVWKGKDADSTSQDKDVLKPWGELNRARAQAYQTSEANRGCPYLQG